MQQIRPLLVYLDTQDFIKLHNHPDWTESQKFFNIVDTLGVAGKVKFGFSYLHVVEFLTKPAPEWLDERLARARLIKRVCGTNAFPYPTDLSQGRHFPNDGYWMPLSAFQDIYSTSFDSMLAKMAKVELKELPVNRKARRRFLNKKFLFEFMAKNIPASGFQRAHFGPLPISDDFLRGRYLERYIRGEIDEKALKDALTRSFSDPEEFCRLFYIYKNEEDMAKKMFRSAQATIVNLEKEAEIFACSLSRMRQQRDSARKALRQKGFPEQKVRALTRVKIPSPNNFDLDQKRLAKLFGEERLYHLNLYFRGVLSGKFKPCQSDFGDLFHFFYAYDCDIFRCDLKMKSIMDSCPAFQDKLVARFADLPETIDQRLPV